MIAKISKDHYINTDDVSFIISYSSEASKRIYADAKKEQRLLNLTNRYPTKTLLIMKSGLVMALRYKPSTIIARMENRDPESSDEE